jgi:glycosyltransferase involved in cell wall biosynthesis
MKMLAMIQGKEIAASRYRILQYLPYLRENGIDTDVMEFPGTIKEYAGLYLKLDRYDCIFVQRKRFHFPFLGLLRRRAKKMVYDLDDAVMYKNSLASSPYSRTRQRRFEKMAGACDAIIAGNSFLMEQSLPYNPNVVLIPTSIETERYSLKDYSRHKDIVTIGWIGDHGSIHYLKEMVDVFDEVAQLHPGKVELKIICDVFFDCRIMPVRKVMWSSETEVDELKDCDIGIMPLKDDPWSWGKCGLKILQYFGVGIPAICTPVGVNRDVVKNGESGYWASNNSEWIDMLSRLIDNSGQRETFGIAGRKTLQTGYSVEANSPLILKVVKGACCQV